MQKWEYLHIVVSDDYVVTHVNGEKVSERGLLGGYSGEKLWKFLNGVGQQGWEVIGISIKSGQHVSPHYLLILKRPIE